MHKYFYCALQNTTVISKGENYEAYQMCIILILLISICFTWKSTPLLYIICEIQQNSNNLRALMASSLLMKFISEVLGPPTLQHWDTAFKAKITPWEGLRHGCLFLFSYVPSRLSHFSSSVQSE